MVLFVGISFVIMLHSNKVTFLVPIFLIFKYKSYLCDLTK